MESLSSAQRLAAVIAGDYPIPVFINRECSFRGTIRDLMMAYADWLTRPFANVVPMRFEDVVGPAGGGDRRSQLQTLWRLQLALHVPGRPGDFVEGIFNKNSKTFRKGKIGSYGDEFRDEHYRLFNSLPQDFMQLYGYGDGLASGREHPLAACPPPDAEGRRPTTQFAASSHPYRGEIARVAPTVSLPCLLQEDYRGFNVVRFQWQYIGVSLELGDIGAWPPRQGDVALWTSQGKWIVGKSCDDVRAIIDDRRMQRLEARLVNLENSLQQALAEIDGRLSYLRGEVFILHHKVRLKYQLERVRHHIEKIVPFSRLWKLFSRRPDRREPGG